MSKKINILKSGFYLSILSFLSFLGMIAFSNCTGTQQVTSDPQIKQNQRDTVYQRPVTKYGVPANYNPPRTRPMYGAPTNSFKEMK